ncbi:uncharacterized protein LOC120263676 [Dioscorea cayenensis subsp. rotundata]|uniref:Uncharacterized protein LOC120263676 n=1 Tax=Dioscorea cayennensis subsp. rotundata TaxID=55577 RepID=A0AB40BLE8_DIOCR|nr:uncharacterized protein LOC120263676 [Dioscorea cayenensis subsp. rotundata]
MDSPNFRREGSTSKGGANKRGTPNRHWKPNFDNFLVLLVEQVQRGLKCDKSFKRTAFSYAASTVNAHFRTNFSTDNVENHYRTLKARYVEIKKVKVLSGARWDDQNKVIIFDPLVVAAYVEAHPGVKAFINKPIENYEGHRVYSDSGERSENEGFKMDNVNSVPVNVSDEEPDVNSTPAVLNYPVMPSTIRLVHSARGESTRMLDLTMDRMLAALQNPTLLSEILYTRVIEVDDFNYKVLVEVFDYFQEQESIACGFMARDVDLRKDWIDNFLTSMV